jgi:hypothetical protein
MSGTTDQFPSTSLICRILGNRPIGIVVLSLLYIGYSAIALMYLLRQTGWSENDCDGCINPWTRGYGAYLTALWSLMLVSSIGALFGSKICRMGLLVALAIEISLVGVESYHAVPYLLDVAANKPSEWRSISFWWLLLLPVRWLLWLVLNFWYFLGPRTRSFYAAGFSVR